MNEEEEKIHLLYLTLMDEMEEHLFKLLSSAHGYDQDKDNLMIKIKTEEEFIKIVNTSIRNVFKYCHYENIIIQTLIELQDELPHFKVKTCQIAKKHHA